MTTEEHTAHIGWLLANLQSLEFVLRAYLQKHASTKLLGHIAGESFYTHPVGTELPENKITNFDTLGKLIEKFYALMKQQGREKLDKSIVVIRDVLAHGRISALEEDGQYRLIKYTKPVDGKVKVVFNEEMTEQWFNLHRNRVYNSIMLVQKYY